MQNDNHNLFVGIKLNEKLRLQLDSSKASMKPFFENNDPQFLQMIKFESDEYLAKTTQNGASLENLNNMCSNLKTMIKMICPKFVISNDAIKIYAFALFDDTRND